MSYDNKNTDRFKSALMANMSHELRTPLNIILGMLKLFEPGNLNDDQLEKLGMIGDAADNLLDIVNNILDLSQIEAGDIALSEDAFDPVKTVSTIVEQHQNDAIDKGLKLVFSSDAEHMTLVGDLPRLERALKHLVENALRYTEKGSIDVHLRLSELGDGTARLSCSVSDTGIGIPEHKQAYVFEKFSQVDDTIERAYSGTGMGLAITQKIVELMGGELSLHSIYGEGSVFSFYMVLPCLSDSDLWDYRQEQEERAQNEIDDLARLDRVPIKKARILVAEDQKMNRMLMLKIFQKYGVEQYRFVENGREALMQVQSENFDVVLMDCHMPIMGGMEATRLIRDLPDVYQSNVPIVAITADALAHTKRNCLNVGMDDYIKKPFTLEHFEKVLSRWFMFDTGGSKKEKGAEGGAVVVDLTNLRENSMGDESFLHELVGIFVKQSEEQLDLLSEAQGSGDLHDWVEAAHALKGSAATIGAEYLRKLSAAAQEDKNAESEDKARMVEDIKRARKTVVDALIDEGAYRGQSVLR